MTVFCFLLLTDTKKTVSYVLQLRPKLDYIFFSKIESHDVLYLSWDLVRETIPSGIVDQSDLASTQTGG
jgi:hypothetical protein